MRGSVVELLARRGRLEVLLHNRQGEKEMHWINGHPVSRLYGYSPASTLTCDAAVLPCLLHSPAMRVLRPTYIHFYSCSCAP